MPSASFCVVYIVLRLSALYYVCIYRIDACCKASATLYVCLLCNYNRIIRFLTDGECCITARRAAPIMRMSVCRIFLFSIFIYLPLLPLSITSFRLFLYLNVEYILLLHLAVFHQVCFLFIKYIQPVNQHMYFLADCYQVLFK